ncbi:tetratricopeptide repeat protein [Methylophilus sp. 5]|uniref:O-linked N-acetylglucosamine transferase, SPINDLY family protein n=1 Tax=Methylophilus sp. 5 TaxID=1112274 RepID=UPI00048CCFAE|nr:tetratricopeptide repeat protein [Methylophilus sp. 5]
MTPAIEQLKQQLARAPQDPGLHYELGRHYLALKQAEAAEQALVQALKWAPDHPQILMQLGNTASVRGDESAAAAYFKQSLKQDTQQADVHFNLANSLRKLGQHALAIEHYQQSLHLAPGDAECHNNLGNAYREQGQLDLAVAAYAQAIKLDPQLLHAKVHWIHQKQHMADWQGLDAAIAEVRAALKQPSQAQIPPFAFLAMPGTTSHEQLACASRWAQQHYGHIVPLPALAPKQTTNQRINVAYLSSDFRRHPLAYLITDVIAAHDHDQFDIWLYSNTSDDHSSERQALLAAANHWVDIASMPDAAVAEHMRSMGIDILVDLTGYTQHSRSGIAAYRPARMHINWLGYPGSMGMFNGQPLFDAMIVDDRLQQVAMAERPVPLPCYQPNNAQRPTADAGTRMQHGLPETGFVFCCFNQSFKVTPDVFAGWMRILQQVPGSVLWLLQCNQWATRQLQQQAQAADVEVGRLVFAPRTSIEQHIARQQHADLMLDTAPYNAHTTASDALWQGVPLLTVAGDTFPARVSASLLNYVGLSACVCADWAVFEQRAIALANDAPALALLKSTLKSQAKKLFEPNVFCRQLEQAYQQLLP